MKHKFLRRAAALSAAIVLVLVGTMDFATRTATAESPDHQGWWTTSNPGPSPEGLPTPAYLAPPDVPPSGLLVQGGPNSPNAYAALIYQLPKGATLGQLTLKVDSNAATTSGTTLLVCPLVYPTIKAEQGGPMADAPQYNCAKKATAQPSGTSYRFDVAPLVSGGALTVAILPTNITDRVVFDQPGADSLALQSTTSAPEQTPSNQATAAPATTSPPLAASGASRAPVSSPPDLGAGVGTSSNSAAAAPTLSSGSAFEAPTGSTGASGAAAAESPSAAESASTEGIYTIGVGRALPGFLLLLLASVAVAWRNHRVLKSATAEDS